MVFGVARIGSGWIIFSKIDGSTGTGFATGVSNGWKLFLVLTSGAATISKSPSGGPWVSSDGLSSRRPTTDYLIAVLNGFSGLSSPD